MNKLFCLIIILLLCFSCRDSSSSDPDLTMNECGDYGTWDESSESCNCLPYYEGQLCENEMRAKYLGTFKGIRTCPCNSTQLTAEYTLNVTPGDQVNQFELEVVWGNGSQPPIKAMLDEDNNVILSEIEIGNNTYTGVFTNLDDGTFEWYIEDQPVCGCNYSFPK